MGVSGAGLAVSPADSFALGAEDRLLLGRQAVPAGAGDLRQDFVDAIGPAVCAGRRPRGDPQAGPGGQSTANRWDSNGEPVEPPLVAVVKKAEGEAAEVGGVGDSG